MKLFNLPIRHLGDVYLKFAWFPIQVETGDFIWLEHVWAVEGFLGCQSFFSCFKVAKQYAWDNYYKKSKLQPMPDDFMEETYHDADS